MARPELSIIVVSYNTREMTLACLASVYAQTKRTRFELIVVDNQSSDGSAQAIAEQFPEVRLIEPASNLGFAGANNLAVCEARADYLLLLNPDTLVLDGAIDRVMAFARQNEQAGIWGGRTVYADHSLNPYSCWARSTPWNQLCRVLGLAGLFRKTTLFNGEAYGGWARDTVAEVDIVAGCFLLIRRRLWEQLEGFDTTFFMYGEEADLCLRARRQGAKPCITPDAVIVHYGGASEKLRSDKVVRLLKAKALLCKRHWSASTQAWGLAMLQAWVLSRAWAFRVLAPFGKGWREHHACWREVWTRRREWRHGYVEPSAGAVPSSDSSARLRSNS